MRPGVLTNCMGMRLSDRPSATLRAQAPRCCWAHAGEVAQWTAQLLAWLWLAEQGARWGWSTASGVLAVALWWAVRVMVRGRPWSLQAAPWLMGVGGGLTAGAVWMPALLAPSPWAHAALLLAAGVWGSWSALIETRGLNSTFRLSRWAWHPVLAALLVWGIWMSAAADVVPTRAVSMALGLCALVLYLGDRSSLVKIRSCARMSSSAQSLLAPSAMGLMMGTLWLGNSWCVNAGWTQSQIVAAHVLLMAGLPSVAALVWPLGPRLNLPQRGRDAASLFLLALGALMLLGNSPLHGVLAMLLPSLAWALHCNRHRSHGQGLTSLTWNSICALLLGPVLLMAVGLGSTAQGPQALQMAQTLLGVLAGVGMVATISQMYLEAVWSKPLERCDPIQ
jgi:hypothetical protein